MKKILIIFICIFIMLFYSVSKIVKSDNDNNIIYIDPGHGGKDKGCSFDDIYESKLNLDISQKLKRVFEEYGYKVLLTRDGDYDLASDNSNRKRSDLDKRLDLINKSNAVLSLSIHINKYSNSKYKGAQVFYNKDNNISKYLSSSIQQSIISNLKNTNRKAMAISGKYLIDNIKKPFVLIECGFISNESERNLLINEAYQYSLSKAIYLGCRDYLNSIQ